jgi:multiple sugar transport system substrate-binding protein
MDNLSKDGNIQNNNAPTSGDIFTNKDSTYGEALKDVPGQQPVQPYVEDENINNLKVQNENEYLDANNGQNVDYGQSSGNNPPPPFEENKTKKYVIIFLIAIIILGLFFLVFKYLFNKKPTSPKDTKITLIYWGLWENEDVMRGVIDDYERNNPNISIKYLRQNITQYRERLQAAIDRGEGPDIFRFHNTWVPMLRNQLAPLPKILFSDEEYKNTFYPVALSDLLMGENYYGIPLEIDGLLLYYNEDILKSANVPVPKTWIDMQNAAQTLTVKEKGKVITGGVALGTAENIENFSDILGLMMLQNSTKLSSSLLSCVSSQSTNCAIETLAFYRKFGESPNNSWDASLDNSILSFSSAKVAMIIAPSFQAFKIADLVKNNGINLNFKTAQVPQLPCPAGKTCSSINWATYWVEGVSVKSKNSESAWKFLKYLSEKDTMEKMYQEQIKTRKLFGEPYSRVDLGTKLIDNPYIAPLIAEAPTMKSFYLSSNTQEGETGINSRLINYLKDAVNSLSEGVSPDSAIKTADNGFKQVFQSFGINPLP